MHICFYLNYETCHCACEVFRLLPNTHTNLSFWVILLPFIDISMDPDETPIFSAMYADPYNLYTILCALSGASISVVYLFVIFYV